MDDDTIQTSDSSEENQQSAPLQTAQTISNESQPPANINEGNAGTAPNQAVQNPGNTSASTLSFFQAFTNTQTPNLANGLGGVNFPLLGGQNQNLTSTKFDSFNMNNISTAPNVNQLGGNLSLSAVKDMLSSPNAMFNAMKSGKLSSFPEGFQKVATMWQYNFGIVRGPFNPVFNDATLSYQDIAWGNHLEYNPNGILWSVNAAGIPTYEDMNNYLEQNRIIEATTNRTMAEIQPLINAAQAPPESKGTEDSQEPSGTEPSRTSATSINILTSHTQTNSGDLFQKSISDSNLTNKSESRPTDVTLVSNSSSIPRATALSSFTQFDPNKAVEYAHMYVNSSNPAYPNWGDNDCTNFVSQCWAYAGIPTSLEWFCANSSLKTNSWRNVEDFTSYMVNAGYCHISYSSKDAHIGDVVEFYNDENGWHHAAIITNIDAQGNMEYSGHSNARYDYPLSEVYPQSGEKIRFICVYQRFYYKYAPDIPTA